MADTDRVISKYDRGTKDGRYRLTTETTELGGGAYLLCRRFSLNGHSITSRSTRACCRIDDSGALTLDERAADRLLVARTMDA